MSKRIYKIGLFDGFSLTCEEDDKYYYDMNSKYNGIIVVCDWIDHSTKLLKRQENDYFYYLNEYLINGEIIEDNNEDGSRWEGDWYNEKPFGFGSVYDGEGNKIYSGFMFDGKKIGFGTEYFADIFTIAYCGNFLNDKRHGWGESYDRNGNKLFEGDWRCGKNDFEERIVIEDKEDCLKIHDLIKELEIGENCFNEWKDDLVIQNYPNLQSIVVKKKSLKNLNILKICNCENLKTIEIEDGDGWKENGIWYTNGAFSTVDDVIIESI